MNTLSRSSLTRSAALGLGVVFSLTGSIQAFGRFEHAAWVSLSIHQSLRAAAERDLRIALVQAGLVPDALTALGFSPDQVSAVVANVRAAVQAGLPLPNAAEHERSSLQGSISLLEGRARRGLASGSDLQQLAALRDQLAVQTTAYAAAVAGVRTAAGLSADAATALQRIQFNRRYDLAADFLGDTRDQATLVALREATTQVAQTPSGEDAPQAARNAVLAADGQAGAATAKVNREGNGTANDAAWRNAAGG